MDDSIDSSKEVIALVKLLDDTEEDIGGIAHARLIEIGSNAIPILEKTWENTVNTEVQSKLELIIQEIQFNDTCQQLRNWDLMGSTNLFTGASIITRLQYPEMKTAQIKQTLENITDEIRKLITCPLTPLELIKTMNHILYNVFYLSGNFSNYYSPQNYYINKVIESRKGNPITLGIIYITIAEMLNIPIFGVNLPKNFILVYKDANANNKDNESLFYINPYNKGAILGKREIDIFLKQQKINSDKSYYSPCSNNAIIERLITNLIKSFESIGQAEKVSKYSKMLSIIKRE